MTEQNQSHASDRILANLVEELSQKLAGEDMAAVEAFLSEHANEADKLRPLIPMLRGLVQLGTNPSVGQLTGDAIRAALLPEFNDRPVLGDFRILREVGRGGMGIVYEAEQISLVRRVALKVLLGGSISDPHALARFRNEVRAAALLDHPHIVNVLGVGTERGVDFYTMRFVDGRTLAEIFKVVRSQCNTSSFKNPSSLAELAQTKSETFISLESKPESTKTTSDEQNELSKGRFSKEYFGVIAKLGSHAAMALAHAHDQGVIHRDIKPSNLMLDSRGHLWITDFGLARIESSSSLTMTGDFIGTLRYMSPEQLLAKLATVDHRSDIYSLGATLYEMATQSPLIIGSKREDILTQVIHGSPIAPRRIQTQMPRDLETILLKAIAKDRMDRYATSHELSEDLQRFIDHRPIMARRQSASLRLVRWSQRNPQLATMSLLFAFLSVVGFAVSAWWIDAKTRQSRFDLAQRKFHEAAAFKAQKELATQNDVTQMINATQYWRTQDTDQLESILKKSDVPTDDSNFLRNFLRRIAATKPAVLGKHIGEAFCVQLAPDENLIASAGTDGVRIHDRLTGRLVQYLKDHREGVNGVAWSGDGKLLATAGDDGQIFIYRTDDWSKTTTLNTERPFVSVAFSVPLGLLVACERERTFEKQERNLFHIWDMQNDMSHQVFSGPSNLIEGLSISCDGMLAAAACRDAHIYVWDLKERKLLHRLLVQSNADIPEISAVAFAHKSNLLAACAREGSIRIFNGQTGEQGPILESASGIPEAIAFSPDDKSLVVGTRNWSSYCYDLSRADRWGQSVEFTHLQQLWGIDIASDGLIYYAGNQGLIEYWDRSLPNERRRIKFLSIEDRQQLHVEEEPKIKASNWKASRAYERGAILERNKPQHTWNSVIKPLLNGKHFAVASYGNSKLSLCDSSTGETIAESPLHGMSVILLSVSPDTKTIAAASVPRNLTLYDAETLKLISGMEFPREFLHSPLLNLAFSADSTVLNVSFGPGKDNSRVGMLAIDVKTLNHESKSMPKPYGVPLIYPECTEDAFQFMLQNFDNPLYQTLRDAILQEQVKWIGCSKALDTHVCLFHDSTIRVFQKDHWQQPRVFNGGSIRNTLIAISPDGSLIAACENDKEPTGTVRLIHTQTGRELFGLRHYLKQLSALCFSLDGNELIATGVGISGDEEIVIWGGR